MARQPERKLRHRRWYIGLDASVIIGFTLLMWWLIDALSLDEREFAFTTLVAVLGAVLGCVVALVLTPFSVEERTQWSRVQTALVGVATGYGVGKLDGWITYLFESTAMMTGATFGLRLVVFSITCGFSFFYGYAYRKYYVGLDFGIDPGADEEPTPKRTSGGDAPAETPAAR